MLTGIGWDDANGDLLSPNPSYVFQMPTNGVFSNFLSAAATTWITPHTDPSLLNLYTNANLFTVQNNVSNWFGLRLLSVEFTAPGPSWLSRTLGQSAGRTNNYFFANFDQPSLSTTGYVFGGYNNDGSYSTQGPVPGDFAFSPTNAQPLLVASLGNAYQALAFAKQTILNGNRTKPAYLGQYFENALVVGTNGAVTTNQAGTLSPYGDFFPTQPGTAALVTMTNWGVNERGTGTVYVVALGTDANRDGVIDPTVFGPDFTTSDHPFRFWVNDNNDAGDDQGNGIPLLSNDPAANNYEPLGLGAPDSVHGTRDLVDWFPVFVSIQNLLRSQTTVTNLTFRLSQAEGTLNFVETSLTVDHCLDYLTDTNVAQSLAHASAAPIKPTGPLYYPGTDRLLFSPFSQDFLTRLRDSGQGIILVEARNPTSAPLVLEVWQGTNVLAQASLWLSISGVEQMFRQKNLIREAFPSTTEFPGVPDRLTTGDGYFDWDPTLAWNEPDTNDKNFVFLHGYSNNPDQARGVFADVFKRMFWSGSHAKFYGVTWFGSDTQGNVFFPGTTIRVPGTTGVTPNYHTNVYHALQTAPNLARFLGTLTNGQTTVAAHSPGNMVVLSALSDSNALMSKYFMIDAAVSIEAIQGNAPQTADMIYSDWVPYANRLYSHEWHDLFPAGDGRSALTWTNRVGNFQNTAVYNFYSSGEEVLRDYSDDPPPGFLSSLPETIWAAIQGASGSWVWVWQEKGKGRAALDNFMASTHGGWKFNYHSPYLYTSNGFPAFMTPSQASTSAVPDSQLRTNAFFDLTSSGFGTADTALYGAGGSTYAQTNGDRMLSDAIPALTLPVGANPVPRLVGLNRNFDMQTTYESGWPSDRGPAQWPQGTTAAGEWHHGDFRQVGYTFTHKLFDDFVNFGNLK